MWGLLGAVWGIAGIAVLLVKAIVQFTPIGRRTLVVPEPAARPG